MGARWHREVFVATLACAALVACGGGGGGTGGGGGGGGGGVVVTGSVAADEVGQSRGIGSYDLADDAAGQVVTVYDRAGRSVARIRVGARPTEGLVYTFEPEAGGAYTAGSARLVEEGQRDGAVGVTRLELRVPDDRAPMRSIRLDVVGIGPSGGADGTGEVRLLLRAPVDLNADYPPAAGASFVDSSATAQATLLVVSGGTTRVDAAGARAWLEGVGLGAVGYSPTTSLLFGALFDARLTTALEERARERLEGAAAGVDAGATGRSAAALHEGAMCERSELEIECRWECASEGDLPGDWLAFVQPDCLACMTLYLPRFRLLGECLAARFDAVDDAWCKTQFASCGLGLYPIAARHGHACRCVCRADACAAHCAAIGNLFHFTETGTARCAPDEIACDCTFDPTSYCDTQWGASWCGAGAYLDPISGFACDTAACGDGDVAAACERNPGRVEACDASAPSGHAACGAGFECIDCGCVPCAQSVECGDGRISTNCPDFMEECDPAADPPGCPEGYRCEQCGCVAIVAPPVGAPDAGGTAGPDTGGPGGGGGIPAVCTAMLECARVAAAGQYESLYDTLGPGGSCHAAIGLPAGTCERACQEALDAWKKDGDC